MINKSCLVFWDVKKYSKNKIREKKINSFLISQKKYIYNPRGHKKIKFFYKMNG